MKEPAAVIWHGVGGRRVARTIRKDFHAVQSVRHDIVIVQLGRLIYPFARLCYWVLIPRTSSACYMLHKAFSLLCMLNYSASFGDVVQQRLAILTRHLRVVLEDLEPMPHDIYCREVFGRHIIISWCFEWRSFK